MRAQLSCHATWLEDADAHVPLGDFLMQSLGESVHAELCEVVYRGEQAAHLKKVGLTVVSGCHVLG